MYKSPCILRPFAAHKCYEPGQNCNCNDFCFGLHLKFPVSKLSGILYNNFSKMQFRMEPKPARKGIRNHPILPIFLVVLIDMIGFGIVIPLLAPLLLDVSSGVLSASVTHEARFFLLGLLLASYSIAQFFGGPILGALSDKHGRRPVLLWALAGTFIGYLIFAFGIVFQSIELLFIGRVVGGFLGGSISVAYSAIADVSDMKEKARNFGLLGMAFGFGFIIGPFIGGKLADSSIVGWFNFSTPFFFTALLTLINIVLVIVNFKETIPQKSQVKISFITGFKNLGKAFTMPSIRTLFFVVFLLAFGFSFFTQFSQVYLIERFQFTESQIGDLFAYIGIWIALTQGVITRPVSRYINSEQALRIFPLMLSISLIGFLLVQDKIFLYAVVPLIAISQGLIYPNVTALVSNMAGKESQGEIFGINQSIQSVALFLPPLISGVIAAVHFTLPIIAAAFFVFVGWAVYTAFFKPKKAEVFHEV